MTADGDAEAGRATLRGGHLIPADLCEDLDAATMAAVTGVCMDDGFHVPEPLH